MENRGSEHVEGIKIAEERFQRLSELAKTLQWKALELVPDPVARSYAEILKRIKEGDDPASLAFQAKYAEEIEASIPVLAHALTHGYISGLFDRLVAASGILTQATPIPIDCALKQTHDAEGVKEDQYFVACLFYNHLEKVESVHREWSPMMPNGLILEALQGNIQLPPSPRRDYWAFPNMIQDANNASGFMVTLPSNIKGLHVEYLYEHPDTQTPTISLVVEKLL